MNLAAENQAEVFQVNIGLIRLSNIDLATVSLMDQVGIGLATVSLMCLSDMNLAKVNHATVTPVVLSDVDLATVDVVIVGLMSQSDDYWAAVDLAVLYLVAGGLVGVPDVFLVTLKLVNSSYVELVPMSLVDQAALWALVIVCSLCDLYDW